MICEDNTGQTASFTAMIIPTDANEPIRTRPVVYYSITDQLTAARARFQAGSSEVLLGDCCVFAVFIQGIQLAARQ